MGAVMNLLVRCKDSSIQAVEVSRAAATEGVLQGMRGREVVFETPLDDVSWWSIVAKAD